MLELDLKKRMPSLQLDVRAEIKPAFTALFGPSGGGKTTTLNLIAGLRTPDSGRVAVAGRVLFSSSDKINVKPRKRKIGYVFQETRLFPHLNVARNLKFAVRYAAGNGRSYDYDDIVRACGITRLLDRMPHALSGGEKQRVALARALLANPEYLLMDEPLAALDHAARLGFLDFLKKIHAGFDLPILYVSHDVADIIHFADEVVVLNNGSVAACGKPTGVLDKMVAPPLVSRQDISNIIEVEVRKHDTKRRVTLVRSHGLDFILPLLDVPESSSILLNLPASEIILATEEPRGLSASNIFPGTVSAINHLGERVLVEVDAGQNFTVEIVEATIGRLALEVGKPVYLIFKAASFRRIG